MKVFISWSGERSRQVAELLSEWLKCVIQSSRPWISTRDIESGSYWFSEISDQLRETSIGVICLTAENKDKPWIMFEAGALAKGLPTNRVCTFLVDLDASQVKDPLAQFNHTTPTSDSMFKMLLTINRSNDNNQLEEKILKRVFETYWQQFQDSFRSIIKNTKEPEAGKPRNEKDLLTEILESVRNLSYRVRRIERDSSETTYVIPPPPRFNRMQRTLLSDDLHIKVIMDMIRAKRPLSEIRAAGEAYEVSPETIDALFRGMVVSDSEASSSDSSPTDK